MKTLLIAAALLCGFASPALAQPAPSHARAAEELLELMDMKSQMQQAMDVMMKAQTEGNPMLAQFEDVMREFLNKYLAWEQIKPEYVRLYTEVYTEDDLRGLIAFYRTPLGQKVLAATPQVMQRGAEISQRRVQEHLPELTSAILQRMGQQQPAPQP
jgi:uncharacterized protein